MYIRGRIRYDPQIRCWSKLGWYKAKGGWYGAEAQAGLVKELFYLGSGRVGFQLLTT